MEGDFRVGEWLVQPKVGTITKGDHEVSLEPKVMEVLVYLARHTDDVLPKERIIQAVWGDTFVTDEVLTNAISELRRAFGDDAKDPHIIQTLPRRGYRLIAKVTPSEQGDSESEDSASNQLWQQSMVVVFAAVLLLAVVLILWWSWPASPDEPIDSIAVLPFLNDSGDEDSEYLSDGVAATISSSLSQLAELRVLPSSALDRYKGQKVDPQTASRELDVRAVLTGTVLRRGETLGVRVELVDGSENRLLWGEQYTEEFTDIFELQEQVARQIAGALRLQLRPEENERLAITGTKNLKAYEYYLKGQFYASDDLTIEGQRKAIVYFDQAVAEDPEYAQAYVALGESWSALAYYSTSEAASQRAKEAYQTAFRLQPGSAAVNLAMVEVFAWYDRDWDAAEEAYRQALKFDSKIPGPEAGNWSWHYLLWQGRREEALQVINHVAERGDPLSPSQLSATSWIYYLARDYPQVLKYAREAIRLGANDDYPQLALAYLALGREEKAIQATLESFTSDADESGAYYTRSPSLSEAEKEELRQALAESGMRGFYRIQSQRERINRPYDRAGAWALAGEPDLAFRWLKEALQLPRQPPFVTDYRFDSLRDDPRFEQFLRKLNLPEKAIQRHLAAAEGTP
jgi:DNA-binding winged helix-turn-helix (wHTH) protein/TolB-like protein/Tfp pilus assembly protein PilF